MSRGLDKALMVYFELDRNLKERRHCHETLTHRSWLGHWRKVLTYPYSFSFLTYKLDLLLILTSSNCSEDQID